MNLQVVDMQAPKTKRKIVTVIQTQGRFGRGCEDILNAGSHLTFFKDEDSGKVYLRISELPLPGSFPINANTSGFTFPARSLSTLLGCTGYNSAKFELRPVEHEGTTYWLFDDYYKES
jgi:hypothetical protein